MSPENKNTTIVLEPTEINGEDYQEDLEIFDLAPRSVEALQNHIQKVPDGKVINLCL